MEKKPAKNLALTLRAYNMCNSNNFSHSNIIPLNHINTDFVNCLLRFGKKNFEIQIPTGDDCSNQHQNLQKWPEIYIDGSKLDGRIGAGIPSTCLAINKVIRIPAAFSNRKYAPSMKLSVGLKQTDNLSQIFMLSQTVRQPYGHWTLLTSRRGQSSLAAYLLMR